ncbi:MAG: Asp-tRNA(Asn)/Glu-tRNA(Gln) amidotransferase subunit GatA [Candidatus Spechtbacterales bacterium]
MTVKEIIKKLKEKEISSAELVEHYLGRIKEADGEIKSYLSLNEEARKEALSADEKLSARGDSPLFGIPYAVKDNILAKDLPATAGSRMLENYTAAYESTVVKNLRGEGSIILGKTNMDEFAMGSSTENSAFGPTKNPVDTARVPGGSSGGSAAAVAAGLAPWALGSDTGGSIRQPAAFCGVVGFKPTYGAVSRHGLIAMASSLDQIGPLTRTVEDAKIVFPYLLGRDKMDATSLEIEEQGNIKNPKNLKIGIVKEFLGEGLDERIKNKTMEALDVYKSLGAEVKEISLPRASYGLAVYYIIMPSEVSSNLARYDGIRYGKHIAEDFTGDLLDGYIEVRGAGLGKETKRRIMLGTHTLSSGYYDAYYLKAQKVRSMIAEDFAEAFKEVDVIVSPTTPGLPFKFGEKTDNPISMYLSDVYTVSANLVGLPAISIPVGTVSEDGKDLPVGLQLMSPHKKDYELLDIAGLYEKEVS